MAAIPTEKGLGRVAEAGQEIDHLVVAANKGKVPLAGQLLKVKPMLLNRVPVVSNNHKWQIMIKFSNPVDHLPFHNSNSNSMYPCSQ